MAAAAAESSDNVHLDPDPVVENREDGEDEHDEDDDDEFEDALDDLDLGHLAVGDSDLLTTNHVSDNHCPTMDHGLPRFNQPLVFSSCDTVDCNNTPTADRDYTAVSDRSPSVDGIHPFNSNRTVEESNDLSALDSQIGTMTVSDNSDNIEGEAENESCLSDTACGSVIQDEDLSFAGVGDHDLPSASCGTDDFTCDPPPLSDLAADDILGAGPPEEDGSEEEQDPVRQPAFEVDEEEERVRELELEWSEEEKEVKKTEANSLKSSGNRAFKAGEFDEAEDHYTQALSICPTCFANERSIIYSNRSACKLKKGEDEGALLDCSRALKLNPDYIKCLLRRAELYERVEKLDEALTDYKHVYELDRSLQIAAANILRLEHLIHERNEKMKEEMLGQLKNLGNMILKPFGLSTENFQLQQDPSTGGYSINFSR